MRPKKQKETDEASDSAGKSQQESSDKAISKKSTPGPPPIEINYSVLDALLQFKVKKNYVCEYLEISEDTLDRRLKRDHNMTFTEYHALRLQRTSVRLQKMAIEMAMGGKNTAMMIFCLKNIAGWCDDPIDGEILNRSIVINYNIMKKEKSNADKD